MMGSIAFVLYSWMYRDTRHVEWVKAFLAVLEELRKYVLEFHTTGLTWNPEVCNSQFLKKRKDSWTSW